MLTWDFLSLTTLQRANRNRKISQRSKFHLRNIILANTPYKFTTSIFITRKVDCRPCYTCDSVNPPLKGVALNNCQDPLPPKKVSLRNHYLPAKERVKLRFAIIAQCAATKASGKARNADNFSIIWNQFGDHLTGILEQLESVHKQFW